MIHLLVIAPALAMRAGLRALLRSEEGFEVLEGAAMPSEVEVFPAETDVVVLGDEAAVSADLEQFLELAAEPVGLLLITDDPGALQLVSGLPVRGWGVLPSDASAEELAAAVRAVHEGLVVGAPPVMEPLLTRRLATEVGERGEAVESLTEREVEVLEVLAQGLSNKQIAVTLNISEHTVKFHVSSIYGKLGATNRAEAVRLGARRGLITL